MVGFHDATAAVTEESRIHAYVTFKQIPCIEAPLFDDLLDHG